MRVTALMVKEMRALMGTMRVQEIADRLGVHNTQVYYFTNEKHAKRRREQWRAAARKRRDAKNNMV
jgi:hypothetical protein